MSSLRAVSGVVEAKPRAGRCIVLAERDGPAPTLLEGLTRRGMLASVVSDAPAVMVELARARAAALILALEPSTPWVGDLLDAVRTYYPHTGCWAYRCEQDEVAGRLIKVESPAQAAPGATESVIPPPSPEAFDGREAEEGPLISQEEMAMLLGRGEDEAEPRWGG